MRVLVMGEITYNGFKPGEARSQKHRPKKADNGHSVVRTTVYLKRSGLRFGYIVQCECGKVYTGKVQQTAIQTWTRHKKEAGA